MQTKRDYQLQEYRARINRVIDHIQANLHTQLTLEGLSRVANFSRFHFHRIFTAMVGETLNQFIQRVRVEKAAGRLIANPKKSITEIALDCGFGGSASFARLFKEAYGMSASDWRSGGYNNFSKIRKTDSKNDKTVSNNGKEPGDPPGYFDGTDCISNHLTSSNYYQRRSCMSEMENVKVDVEELPETAVAYVRHIGPYQGNSALFEELWGKLMKWAGPRNLIGPKMISIYYDDPNISDESRLRVDVCITVPEDTSVDGEVGKLSVPAGKYAMAHFEIDQDEYGKAWDYVFGQWLPQSGYQPDDRPSFELYRNNPEEHPQKKHIVDICVPVKPL